MQFKGMINAIADRVMKMEGDSEGTPVAGERKPESMNRINRQIEDWIEKLNSGDIAVLKTVYNVFAADEDFLWHYIPDNRNDISKAAYLSILKRDFYPGAERIYDAYIKTEEEHQKRYLLNLLLRESSWNRLPYLVRMYHRGMPEEESCKVLPGISNRFMYGKISQSLREEVLLALEENGRELPDGMEKAILYDMKYV